MRYIIPISRYIIPISDHPLYALRFSKTKVGYSIFMFNKKIGYLHKHTHRDTNKKDIQINILLASTKEYNRYKNVIWCEPSFNEAKESVKRKLSGQLNYLKKAFRYYKTMEKKEWESTNEAAEMAYEMGAEEAEYDPYKGAELRIIQKCRRATIKRYPEAKKWFPSPTELIKWEKMPKSSQYGKEAPYGMARYDEFGGL